MTNSPQATKTHQHQARKYLRSSRSRRFQAKGILFVHGNDALGDRYGAAHQIRLSDSTRWKIIQKNINILLSQRFHRTVTVDYAIVTKGTITLILDDGEQIKASAGDVVIQRGTIHRWANEGDEWTRVLFVLIREYSPSK